MLRHAALLFAVAGLWGCSADDGAAPADGSADEIRVLVNGLAPMYEGTRAANTFESNADLTISAKGGSRFTLSAYDATSGSAYIDAEDMQYFTDNGTWLFHDYSSNKYIRYFWPESESAAYNFFAYMPSKNREAGTPIVTDIDYITAINYNGGTPTFTCADLPLTNGWQDGLPLTYTGQDGLKEFVYAYTAGQTKESQGSTGVSLQFLHPFAAISFKLTKALQRLVLNSITIKDIYNSGTATYNATGPTTTWATSGSTGDFVVTVGRKMDTNLYLGLIDGPFLVVPQEFPSGHTIEVNVDYDNATNKWPAAYDDKTISVAIPYATLNGWLAGYKYTYLIDLDEDTDAITIQNISVEPWEGKGEHTTANVE